MNRLIRLAAIAGLGTFAWRQFQKRRAGNNEFGGSDDPICLGAMDKLLAHLGENSDAWLGWTIWSSSEWNIQHNIRPVNGRDPLQMRVLMRHVQSE